MSKTKSSRRKQLLKTSVRRTLFIGLGLCLPSVRAANDAFSVDATSGLFSSSFTPGTTTPVAGGTSSPGTGDALYFGTQTTGTTTLSNDLVGFTFAGFTFNALASSFTISGNDFSLGGPILNNSQSLQTINNNIALTAASTFTTSANGGNLVLGGALSGANAITFAGSGFTTLTGNNSNYSAVSVLNGTNNVVRITNANALGTGALNINGLTTLELAGGITFSNNVTALTGRTAAFLRNFSGTNTYSGTVTQTTTGGGTGFESAGGFLNFTGTLTSNLSNNPRVLYLLGAGDGSFTSASTVNGTSSTSPAVSAFNQITKTGGGTWTLAGSATAVLSGATTVQGGTVAIDNTTGTFGSGGALTFSANGGTFNFIGNAAGTSKTLGALTFTLGRGVPQITNNGGTVALTFASLATRAAGATGNFVTSGGTVGTPNTAGTNQFLFTTTPGIATTVDPGLFFNGSNYAFYDATAGVRALVYGTDAGATTTGATPSVTGTNVQITGDVSAQATATLTTLNLSGNRNLTLASGATLTVNGLLQTGNTAGGSTISGGTGIRAASAVEMVTRTDGANDALTISTPVLANGANALTKTGAGTLTLSAANTYTGNTNLLQGTLNLTNTNIGGGTTTVQGGTLNVTGAGGLTGSTTTGTLTVNPTIGGLATLNINTTGTLLFGLGGSVGVAATGTATTSLNNTLDQSNAILNLQAGTIATGGVAGTQRDLRFGDNSGFGTANITGGNMNIGGYLVAGFGSAGAGGIVNLSGGAITINSASSFGGTIGTTANAYGVMNVSGGSYNSQNTTASGAAGIFIGENGVGNLNVSGTGVLNLGGVATSAGLDIGRNAGAVGIVNLGAVGAGGGTITTNIVRHTSTAATGIFNFHGGTLQAAAGIASTGTAAGTGNSFMGGLSGAYVYSEGGAVNNNGQAITITQPLLAPTGNGITAIPVATGGSNYATAPIVNITGGGGTGATAVATVNGSGVLTGITITNPGTGYTSTPTITLVGGALSGSTPATFGSATLAANTSGGLSFSGAGTTTLTGTNTYTGATAINAGTLAVSNTTGSGTGTGAVNVNSGGTLAGTGTISGLVTFNTGSSLLAATTGTFLTTSGGLTFAGQTSLTLSGTITTGSTYTFLNYGGALNGLANLTPASRGTIASTGTTLTFTAGTVASDTWAVTSGTWDAGVTPNWTNGVDNKFFNGDTVTFGDNNPGKTNTVTLTGNLQPATPVTVNNSTTAYTFSGSGSIGGPASLTKSGSGLLTINTANSYTGGTTISGGTVAINSATSLGAATGAVAINAATMEATATISSARAVNLGSATSTIQVDPTFTYTLSGALADVAGSPGTLNKTGTGTLALTGTLTGLTGGANVTAGTLSLPATLGPAASTSTINIASAGTVTFTGGTVTNTITGAGAINNNTSGTVVFTNDASAFTGTFTQNGANNSQFSTATSASANAAYTLTAGELIFAANGDYTVPFGSLASAAGNIRGGNSATGTATLQVGNLNTSTSIAGNVNNGTTKILALTKVGTGTLTLAGADTFGGATIINGGTLLAAGNGALGQLGATVGGTATTAVGTASISVNAGTLLGLSGTTTGTGTTAPTGVFDRVKDTAPISLGTAGGAGGTIALSGTGPVLEGTAVSNSGGTLTNSPFRNATATSTLGLGALTLTSSSTLNFAGTIGTLVFTSFTPGGFTLNVTGYSSASNRTTISGVDGTDDRLVFAADQTTNINAGAFLFNGSATGVTQITLDSGYYEIVAPVPEPATWLGAALLVGSLGYSRRRQIGAWLAAPRAA